MKKLKLMLALLPLAVAATAVSAQTSTTTTTTQQTVPVTSSDYRANVFGAVKGDWEFTLGGSGGSNKDFDDSLGGLNLSLGYYLTDGLELTVRQSANYSNGSGGGAEYDGSTFVALDYNFGTGRLRPFVGVNFGRLYGDNTNETWAAGVEGGLKFYVQPKTFLFVLANYAWTFEDADNVTDAFDDGAVLWSAGVGFNF